MKNIFKGIYMYNCIDSKDKQYSIQEYCLLKKTNREPKQIYCPFCTNKLYIRAENSLRQTHFMHCNNTTCLSKDYKDIFGRYSIKKTKNEILCLKFNILFYSYDIFKHIQKKFNLKITPEDFVNLLKKIVDKKVLNLLNIKPEHIAYICINELGIYNNRTFLYTNKFNSDMSKLWNLSHSSEKNIILSIEQLDNNKIIRSTIPIDTNFLGLITSNVIPINFISKIIPNIFYALKIDSNYHEILLKDILEYV